MRVIDIDVRTLNQLANEPDVLRYLNTKAKFIDLSWVYDRPGALVKGCDGVHGAVVLLLHPGDNYEIHYLMPGDAGMASVKAIVDWMFEHTSAQTLFGSTPKKNIAARAVNRWLGGKIIGELADESDRPCAVYALDRDTWASRKKPVHLTPPN